MLPKAQPKPRNKQRHFIALIVWLQLVKKRFAIYRQGVWLALKQSGQEYLYLETIFGLNRL
ncbi:hypothetical protein C7N43_31230 [Sphingobacteriales bacterium UPWRP_1]|nr:hypothetical protein B6N25_08480 [Sphingobacteriales bacterium TSM_CSS]PSJ73020.1 hypothetical protein C7N43_31230 [Sphingobacteriales bacterium UPWRP_1]